jgi:hypothetical protein
MGKEVSPTFADIVSEFNKEHEEAFKLYPLDEDDDLLGKHCDRLRENKLPKALELAKTKEECQQVLSLTMPRNTELRAQIKTKIEGFKI